MKLKVYGGWSFHNGKQERTVIAAYTQRQVAELTGNPLSYIRGWWAITANREEVELAMENPLTVIYVGNQSK